MSHKYKIFLFLLISFTAIADDAVIEVLISFEDNRTWKPQKSMHLTLAHLKNVEGAEIQQAVDIFNQDKEELLNETLIPGFIVGEFNNNGFGKGYHILEPNSNNANNFIKLNDILYQYLHNSYGVNFTNITSPKYIYDKGYTPHIEFIETSIEKIPLAGIVLKFVAPKLSVRILNFERSGI